MKVYIMCMHATAYALFERMCDDDAMRAIRGAPNAICPCDAQRNLDGAHASVCVCVCMVCAMRSVFI